ncbi:hypothetical protein GQ44DRAFT_722216 [Phaeosphaeriaceae sp. PMI808]|nr:hypothetical protein GQ44DRAFT_722216 [Phaeosphaeriaceae sp. PMI808]
MPSHNAFFYGTLMAPPVLHRVIWNHPTTPPTPLHATLLTSSPALLPAHARHRVKGADYPAVIPSTEGGASVRGVLVTGLSDGDVWRLDVFEGGEYVRRGVRVVVLSDDGAEGESVDAETYVWVGGEERLEREEWDFGEFVREKMGRSN